MLLPALTKAKNKAQGIACLSDTKQVVLGWIMYQGDYAEKLMANTGGSCFVPSKGDDGNFMDWLNNNANTNTAILIGTNALMSPYIKNPGVYKCPGDQAVAQNGPRVKSIAMNAALGGSPTVPSGAVTVGGELRTYIAANKSSQLNTPGPANIFVTLDEHADYMDDSIFNFNPGLVAGAEYFREVPASYHNGACSISFADGHAEIKKWLDGRIVLPVKKQAQGQITVRSSVDYEWLDDRMPFQR
jgi:prepilin-type processing-associated H-X9-DG protein